MLSGTGIIFSGILFCLIGSFFAFALIARKGLPSFNAPFFAVSLLVCCCMVVFALLFWLPADFVSGVSAPAFAVPAIALPALALLTLAFPKPWVQFIALTVCCGGIVFGFGIDIAFSAALPAVVNRFLTALLWLTICYCPRILNLNPGLIGIQTLALTLGGMLLYFIGALPLALGFLSACVAACFTGFLIAGRQNPNLQMSDQMSNLLGFLLGWLIIYASAEGAGSCFAIFALYPLVEIVFAMSQKLTFLPRFAIAKNNTFYLRVIDAEMTPSIVNRHLLRINAVCVLFGSFQTFAPNDYSIPLFCLLVVLWQLYRIYNWRHISYSLKETNQKFINDVRENIQEISQNLKNTGRKKK